MEYDSAAALGKSKIEGIEKQGSSGSKDLGEVNTEATILTDDVIRAGGLGTRDVTGSILPIAVDSTVSERPVLQTQDFEETPGIESTWKSSEVNMEAIMTTDDVTRAGGFGATDGISSFLPVAMDSTDFEASLRDARDYEEPQGEISRPGLGWLEAAKSVEDC